MITHKEYKQKIKDIMEQENKYNVKIVISDIHDKDHLDSIWYGGEVGAIEYKGYAVVISAIGEIRLNGIVDGEEIEFKDKNNGGEAYYELGDKIDDDRLDKLLVSNDKNNYLEYENNNWFEYRIVTPDKRCIDISDNCEIIEGDLLECFDDVKFYCDFIDELIEKVE